MEAGRTHRIERLTRSAEETESFAAEIGERLQSGATICLTGPLGSGKSVMARGLCKGLGVEESVLSPTFILFEPYTGRMPVIHCDLYRLEHEQEMDDLGVFDRIGNGSVLVIEWGDRSARLMAEADMVISLRTAAENERAIIVETTPAVFTFLNGL